MRDIVLAFSISFLILSFSININLICQTVILSDYISEIEFVNIEYLKTNKDSKVSEIYCKIYFNKTQNKIYYNEICGVK